MGFASGMRSPLPPFHASGSAPIRDGGHATGRGRRRCYSALSNDMTRRQAARRADGARVRFNRAPKALTRTGWAGLGSPSASTGTPAPDPFADHRFRFRRQRPMPLFGPYLEPVSGLHLEPVSGLRRFGKLSFHFGPSLRDPLPDKCLRFPRIGFRPKAILLTFEDISASRLWNLLVRPQ